MSRQALLTTALIVWLSALTAAQGTRTVRDGGTGTLRAPIADRGGSKPTRPRCAGVACEE